MATELPISTILSIAKICEYIATINISKNNAFRSGDLNARLSRLIYMERMAVQNRYNINPNDPTLPGTANYLFSILGYQAIAQNILNNLSANPPIITGPSNQSVTVGSNATFSVSVTGTTPFIYQWFLNGIIIPGATGSSYTKINCQLSDSGGQYSVKVTNSAGSANSVQASLTVTASLTAQWWYGATDPYPALSSGSDTLSYQINETIIHNAPIAINYPVGAENNQFNVVRYPNTENDKTTWVNTTLNQGVIPDSTMRTILNINGFKYIISRVAMSLDNLTTTLTYS